MQNIGLGSHGATRLIADTLQREPRSMLGETPTAPSLTSATSFSQLLGCCISLANPRRIQLGSDLPGP